MPGYQGVPGVARSMILLLLMASASGWAQEVATVEGVVQKIQVDDFDQGRSEVRYFLEEGGRTRELRFEEGKVPPLETGDRVRVTGRTAPEGALWTALKQVEVLSRAPAAAQASGEQKAVALLINLSNTSITCSPSEVADVLFTGPMSANAAYQEMSYQGLSFPADSDGNGSPDVFGPFTIQVSRGCDIFAVADAADAAAQAAGIDLSQYAYKSYVLPSGSSCGFLGAGSLGCAQPGGCRSWIFDCTSVYLFAHELGHNLGMLHASSALSTNFEGGDCSDPMGSCGVAQVNAPHKMQMGWLPPDKVMDLQPGRQSLRIANTEAEPDAVSAPMALRALNSYYFSYRQRVGFDASLYDEYVYGVTVHRYNDWYPGDCVNVNPGPHPPRQHPCTSRTIVVGTLQDGHTFEDAGQGLRVTQISHDATGVSVEVDYAPPGRDFYTLTPCRIVDTREFQPLVSGVEEIFILRNFCGVPLTAKALVMNVTVVAPQGEGYLSLFPANARYPGTSSITFSAGRTLASLSTVPLSADGEGALRVHPFVAGGGTVHLALDVSGYFE